MRPLGRISVQPDDTKEIMNKHHMMEKGLATGASNALLDAAVTISPRAIKPQGAPHESQRYAEHGPSGRDTRKDRNVSWRLYRRAGDDAAEMRVRHDYFGEATAKLTAPELRELAQSCIDMAHDIEANTNA